MAQLLQIISAINPHITIRSIRRYINQHNQGNCSLLMCFACLIVSWILVSAKVNFAKLGCFGGWWRSYPTIPLKQKDSTAFLLLMEEFLHQLGDSLSHYLQGFIHIRWLIGISSINSTKKKKLKILSGQLQIRSHGKSLSFLGKYHQNYRGHYMTPTQTMHPCT